MQGLINANVVTPAGILQSGWVAVEGADIAAVGTVEQVPPVDAVVHDFAGAWLVPGFVDVHVHGGGGASVSTDGDECRRVVTLHRRHGTTTMLLSLVSGAIDDMAGIARSAAQVARDDAGVAGLHLEGPFLAPARCGAQDPQYLLRPDPRALDRVLDAAEGTVRVVTVAPELDGGLALVRHVAAAGAIPALGHSAASYAVAREAFEAGARHLTHAFNGMDPLHHREPALIGAALTDPRLSVEVINDGQHLHPATVALVARAVGSQRLLLVTDAMAAAGAGDGEYPLGSQTVVVRGSRAMLADGSSLAGSVLTMDVAFRRAVHDVGLSLVDAVAAASTTPAKMLGIDDRVGSIEPGKTADLVVLDRQLRLRSVMARGEWLPSPTA